MEDRPPIHGGYDVTHQAMEFEAGARCPGARERGDPACGCDGGGPGWSRHLAWLPADRCAAAGYRGAARGGRAAATPGRDAACRGWTARILCAAAGLLLCTGLRVLLVRPLRPP